MAADSTNLRMPFLGNQPALYPQLRQIIRAASPLGPVIGGYTQQWAGTNFRDREQCYLLEPNGIAITPGKYRARLAGAYTGAWGTLPLYVVGLACCAPIG